MSQRSLSGVPLTLFLCSAVLLCAPAVAQVPWGGGLQDHCLDFAPENQIAWPAALGSPPNFGRAVVVDLDGDFESEAVVIANGALVVLWNVDSYDDPEAVTFPTAAPPVDVRDIAALPLGSLDDADDLLMTDERGLLRVAFDPETRTFLDPVVLAEGGWVDAAPIHVEDLDGDGELDVIGISSNKRQLLRLIQDPTGFTPLTTISYPFDMLDALGVNWDGDAGGVREPVALTRRGVVVFLPGGTVAHLYLAVTGCIARLSFEAEERERVAWTRPTNTPGYHELLVLGEITDPSDDGIDGPWPLVFDFCQGSGPGGPPPGPIVPTAILAGHYDLDDSDDLLLVHQGHRTAIMLQNLGSSPIFDTSNLDTYDVIPLAGATSGTANIGIPAFAQLDQHDTDDLVVPVGGTADVLVFLSLSHQRAAQVGTPPRADEVLIDETEFLPGTSAHPHGTLRQAFHVPEFYETYTHVDLAIFEQPNIVPEHPLGFRPPDPDAVYFGRHQMVGEPGPERPDQQWILVEHDFPDGALWNWPRPVYYVEFRFALVDELDGRTLAKSPRYHGAFTLRDCVSTETQPCTPDYEYLDLIGMPGQRFDVYDGNDLAGTPPTGFSTGRTMVGAFAPLSANPPFTPGSSPNRGTLTAYDIARLFANQ